MPFENFYEESDKANRRWWKCVGAAFLLFVGYWTFGFLFIPEPKSQQLRENEPSPVKTIAQMPFSTSSQKLQRVNELCTNLPKPEKFYQLDKQTLVANSDLTLVRYSFKSQRTWDEIMPGFLVWLNTNGWQSLPNDKATFIKNNQVIAFSTVSNDSANSANFEIYCSEKDENDSAISFSEDDI